MDKKELKHLARLSFINLSDDEEKEFIKQLNELFIHIQNTMQQNNQIEYREHTDNTLELFHNDNVKCEYCREDMLINAKQEKKGYILVPKIIKEED